MSGLEDKSIEGQKSRTYNYIYIQCTRADIVPVHECVCSPQTYTDLLTVHVYKYNLNIKLESSRLAQFLVLYII